MTLSARSKKTDSMSLIRRLAKQISHQGGSDHAAVSDSNHHAPSAQPEPDMPIAAQLARASNLVVAPIRFGMD